MSFFTRARTRVAAGAGVVALAAGALMAPPFAAAADVDVIVPGSTKVTNANGDTALQVWQQAGVSFAFDTTGKKVAPGDTFGLTFPAGFQVKPGSFQVFESDPATPDVKGPAVADCTTTPATDAVTAVVDCTFNDYVATHSDITGAVTTWAQMTQTSDQDKVVFYEGGTPVEVDMPGTGGVVDPGAEAALEGAKKQGWTEGANQDSIHWEIIVPGASVREGAALEVTDSYPAGVGKATEIRAERTENKSGWNNATWEAVPSLVVTSDTDTGFTASIPADQVDRNYVYRIVYVTPIDPAIVSNTTAPPTTFVNHATAADVQLTANAARDTVGSGNASGVPVTTPTSTPPNTVTVTTTPPAVTTTETTTVTTPVPTTVTSTATTTRTSEVPTTVTSTLPGTTATVTTTKPCPCESSTPTTATTTNTVTVTTTRGTDTGATTGVTTSPAAGSLGDIVPGSSGGSSNGSLDLGSLDSDSIGGGSSVGTGSLAPLALGSLGLGSAALIGVCMIPIPGLVLPAPLAAFCPAARQPVQPPAPQAPGPVVPNGRG